MVKNLPCNAVDMDSSPGRGTKIHMLQSTKPVTTTRRHCAKTKNPA